VLDGSNLLAPLLLGAFVVLSLLAAGWWLRERRLGVQRTSMRALHALSEDIIAASSPTEIAEILAARLPEATRATSTNLYLFDRRNKAWSASPRPLIPNPWPRPLMLLRGTRQCRRGLFS